MLLYYIHGLAILTGYVTWIVLGALIIYSLYLNHESDKRRENREHDQAQSKADSGRRNITVAGNTNRRSR